MREQKSNLVFIVNDGTTFKNARISLTLNSEAAKIGRILLFNQGFPQPHCT